MNQIWKVYRNNLENHMEDEELYRYGMRQLKTGLLNIATILLLGFLFRQIGEGILFAVCYILLRKSAGGYHAKNAKRCYIDSVILYVGALCLIHFLKPDIRYAGITLFLFFILLHVIPVENVNKPLNPEERRIYKKGAVVLFIFFFLLEALLYKMGILTGYMAVNTAILGTEVLLLLQLMITKIKN